MISLAFLSFILFENKSKAIGLSDNLSFDKIQLSIKNQEICEISYNPSKTSAIVNIDCGSAVYIDFKTKKTLALIEHWPNVFTPEWLSDTVAVISGPCGTGCSQGILFISPDKIVTCSEYQRENDEYVEGYIKSRTNIPLLVDPKREIYVCYDPANNIQIFPFPKYPTIKPPNSYAAEQGEIIDGKLQIIYENQSKSIEMSIVQIDPL